MKFHAEHIPDFTVPGWWRFGGFWNKIQAMGDTPIYKRPWFYIVVWLAILLVIYFWQVFRMGGFRTSRVDIFLDLACIFPFLLLAWMGFFSQFVLPVRTFSDRRKIFDRLLNYLFGAHGPALFVQDGNIKEHSGERLKEGPGVVWLDTASGAVTRTNTKIKQTLGPGVHFLDNKEFIEGTVDLHIQAQTLGPKESDFPFAEQKDEQSQDEFRQIQERRKEVSAWTRDGIEVVPNISISFRVATGFPEGKQTGSRFGYRNGPTRKDKTDEELDKAAIKSAVLKIPINYNVGPESPRRRVPWNLLPGLLAVDIWREYVAKFTFDELFRATQPPLPSPESKFQPTEQETQQLSQAINATSRPNLVSDRLSGMLRDINNQLSKLIETVESKGDSDNTKSIHPPSTSTNLSNPNKASEKMTALQIISEMVKKHLTQFEVIYLDDHGKQISGLTRRSIQFEVLKERGLAIRNVNISNVQFHDEIEKQLEDQWQATWLANAKEEANRINRQIGFAEIAGQEKGELKYANLLARNIIKQRPSTPKETLQTLLMRTRLSIIQNNQLQSRLETEREEIENLLQWMENGP